MNVTAEAIARDGGGSPVQLALRRPVAVPAQHAVRSMYDHADSARTTINVLAESWSPTACGVRFCSTGQPEGRQLRDRFVLAESSPTAIVCKNRLISQTQAVIGRHSTSAVLRRLSASVARSITHEVLL